MKGVGLWAVRVIADLDQLLWESCCLFTHGADFSTLQWQDPEIHFKGIRPSGGAQQGRLPGGRDFKPQRRWRAEVKTV